LSLLPTPLPPILRRHYLLFSSRIFPLPLSLFIVLINFLLLLLLFLYCQFAQCCRFLCATRFMIENIFAKTTDRHFHRSSVGITSFKRFKEIACLINSFLTVCFLVIPLSHPKVLIPPPHHHNYRHDLDHLLT
jgi:hypothetical protein